MGGDLRLLGPLLAVRSEWRSASRVLILGNVGAPRITVNASVSGDVVRVGFRPAKVAVQTLPDGNGSGGSRSRPQVEVLAFRAGNIGGIRSTWFDRNGHQLGTLGPEGAYSEPALSPDGRSVAMIVGAGVAAQFIGVLDVASGAMQRLTFGKELVNAPCWSSDGRSVAYASNGAAPTTST